MWPCKRMMVSSCLDRSEDFENLGSGQLVALVQQFREGLDNMNKLQYNNPTMDLVDPTVDPNLIMGVKPNNKGKTKVNHIKRKLEKEKHGKINYLPNFVPVSTTEPTTQKATTEIDLPAYENEPEEDQDGPVYEDEPSLENRKDLRLDWSFSGQELKPKITPTPKTKAKESEAIEGRPRGTTNAEDDGREFRDDAEAENPKAWEKAKANKQALYSYVGNGGSKKVCISIRFYHY